jgi:cell wall-associated NlpC family hydrolase
MKPGDLVLGYREENDYPHAAVYLGNGKMFNNDSNLGTMAIQSMTKFNSPEFKRFVILRRPETVPAIPVA